MKPQQLLLSDTEKFTFHKKKENNKSSLKNTWIQTKTLLFVYWRKFLQNWFPGKSIESPKKLSLPYVLSHNMKEALTAEGTRYLDSPPPPPIPVKQSKQSSKQTTSQECIQWKYLMHPFESFLCYIVGYCVPRNN